MNQVAEWLQELLPFSGDQWTRLLESVAIVVGLLLLRWLLLWIALRRVEQPKTRYRWQKGATYFTFFVAALLIGHLWVRGLETLSTFLGLLSAGIAIALKDPIMNLAGWGYLLWVRPLEVGDRIQLGPHKGDVIDIRIFHFTILEIGNWVDADQSTGRIIHIPNGKVFTESQASFTKGFQHIWVEIPVMVTFESNWERAKQILQRIADQHGMEISEDAQQQVREASKKYLIYYRNLTPIVYTAVRSNGVLLTIRCLSSPRKRRHTEQSIWEAILREFAVCNDIEFAYPTQRLFSHHVESRLHTDGPDDAPSPRP